MPATAMNHFTILTDDVPTTVAFYRELLGLTDGPRPPFDFPGAWLYAGDTPILHVIGGRPADELRAGVIDDHGVHRTRPCRHARAADGTQYRAHVPPAGRRRHVAGVLLRPEWRARRARFRRGRAETRRRFRRLMTSRHQTPAELELDHLIVAAAVARPGRRMDRGQARRARAARRQARRDGHAQRAVCASARACILKSSRSTPPRPRRNGPAGWISTSRGCAPHSPKDLR